MVNLNKFDNIRAAFASRAAVHQSIFYFGILLMVVGLPLSKFLMSFSQILLAANWLAEGNLLEKFRKFAANRIAVAISSIFLLHVIGLIYTSNFDYAFNDLRIKLPLLLLPLILSTSQPLSAAMTKRIIWVFLAAVFAGTLVSMYYYLGFSDETILNTRGISRFISHIRFGLLLCLSVFIILWMGFENKKPNMIETFVLAFFALWFTYFLFILESITGIIILFLIVFFVATYLLYRSRFRYARILLAVLFGSILFASYLSFESIKKNHFTVIKPDFSQLDKFTHNGNPYHHDTLSPFSENGHLTWLYVSDKELQTWNQRSSIKLDEKDNRGQDIYHTLLRFLTSKGWRKDAQAIHSLSEEEIKAIENGIPNVLYMNSSGVKTRMLQLFWEIDVYIKGGNPSGHSFTQRLEYWKEAIGIIKEKPLVGVGTGDLNEAFTAQYEKMKTKLAPAMRHRAHNQYLTIAVAFGVFGLFWFLFSLLYPLTQLNKNPLYIVFLLVAMLSFLNEDTLETQAGVTFFAFFNAFFLFSAKEEKGEIP